MNSLTEGQNQFWYPRRTWLEERDRQEIARLAFSAGAKWAIRQTSELTPYIARFTEMLMLLGYFDDAMAETPDREESARARERESSDSGSVD